MRFVKLKYIKSDESTLIRKHKYHSIYLFTQAFVATVVSIDKEGMRQACLLETRRCGHSCSALKWDTVAKVPHTRISDVDFF